jgi:hypothetical protein
VKFLNLLLLLLLVVLVLVLLLVVLILLTPCNRFLLEKLAGCQLVKKLPHFIETESSLPLLKEPSICPYSEANQSTLLCPHPLPENPF